MKKRVAAGVLWLFAGWYVGNVLAWMLGVSWALGLVLGIGAALLIAGDPLQVIWQPAADMAKARRRTLDRLPSPSAVPAK